ncbi:MAG: glycosyltransferase, partial [Salegentibacter mishustinae]|nr:glycosyltransferase [Salegentibacter mishustinae]
MDLAIIIIYTLALLIIFFYSISQLQLLLNYLKAKKQVDASEKFNLKDPSETPFVTIQLPLYNELYVVERLLKNIAKMDYPREKLEIQVLDDSTDESVEKIKSLVNQLQTTGLDIQHITRKDRSGFKAGALKEGLKIAKGEFIAIFDSDFLPKKDWLLQTVPYFKDPEIGVVQTRWGHINRDYSLLTKIQAFALDFHFILEQ